MGRHKPCHWWPDDLAVRAIGTFQAELRAIYPSASGAIAAGVDKTCGHCISLASDAGALLGIAVPNNHLVLTAHGFIVNDFIVS